MKTLESVVYSAAYKTAWAFCCVVTVTHVINHCSRHCMDARVRRGINAKLRENVHWINLFSLN